MGVVFMERYFTAQCNYILNLISSDLKKLLKKILHKLPQEITRDKVRDATRLALQSSLSAAVTFFIIRTFGLPEMFLALLSAVLVVEPSIGNSINHAKGRILATIVGSLIGFAFVSIIPYGYGTILSLVVTMFVMNAVASFKPSWRYGVVASVAISLGSEKDALQISIDRLIAIGIGIVVGLLVTAVIWPEKSSSRAGKHLRNALNEACNRFKIAFGNTRSEENEDASEVADNFHTSLGNAKEAAKSIRFGDKNKIRKLIDATEKLYNSILIVHRVAESTDTTLLNKGDDSKRNAAELNEKTCEIINSLINKEMVEDEKMEEFAKLTKQIKNNVLNNRDDQKGGVFEYALIFGIEEIHESLRVLEDLVETR